jgi:hypothetical protein
MFGLVVAAIGYIYYLSITQERETRDQNFLNYSTVDKVDKSHTSTTGYGRGYRKLHVGGMRLFALRRDATFAIV